MDEKVARHSYSSFVIFLCVELYCRSRIGFAKTSEIVGFLNEALHLGFESIPCANTIENWVKKSGFHVYNSSTKESVGESAEYAIISDESMMLGSEKMFLMLGVPPLKKGEGALKRNEVEVLDISVAGYWNSEEIKKIFSKVEKQKGLAPSYVISDNDSKLVKAIREKDYIHMRDVGHTIALQVESVYKEETDFIGFTKKMSSLKIREAMRKTAYLLPPRQRTIARFMNISRSVDWAVRMKANFNSLSEEEREVFSLINEYDDLISELSCVFDCTDAILKILKDTGLSKSTVYQCLDLLEQGFSLNNERVKRLKGLIGEFLKTEYSKLTNKKVTWYVSSDIIESMFGSYKFRRSGNSLHGVTPYVLLLPLLTKIPTGEEKPSSFDFKDAAESIYMKDLTQWRDDKLTENMAVKRRLKLAV